MTFLLKTRADCCMGLLDRDVSLTRHRVHGCSNCLLDSSALATALSWRGSVPTDDVPPALTLFEYHGHHAAKFESGGTLAYYRAKPHGYRCTGVAH